MSGHGSSAGAGTQDGPGAAGAGGEPGSAHSSPSGAAGVIRTLVGRPPLEHLRAVDRWLLADGEPQRHALVRRILAGLLLIRLLTWRYHSYTELPEELVWPVWYWDWLSGMPPLGVVVALQVIGSAAAVGALFDRRVDVFFPVAWVAFLALAGIRAGVGKVLHNDALPLLAMVPFLVPVGRGRVAVSRSGWQLRGAQLVVAAIYFLTGVQKLVHSGPAWVLSDNMRWIMEWAAIDGGFLSQVPAFIAEHTLLWRAGAVGLLGMELAFPLVFASSRLRRLLLAGAITMHLMTLVTLRLDYLSWVVVDLALFVDWRAVEARVRRLEGGRTAPLDSSGGPGTSRVVA